MTNEWFLGIDLGASTYKCGLISPDWKIVARCEAPTLALEGPVQAADRIAASTREILSRLPADGHVTRAGICSPGPIAHQTGMIVNPPNLTGWREVPFAAMLAERLDLPATLEHDAKSAALAEFHLGAGRGAHSMCLIIVGTGIGGAMIVDGNLYRGEQSAAGEIGHFTVNLDGPICTCGSQGCVEAYACGPAIMNSYMYATRKKVESGEEIARARTRRRRNRATRIRTRGTSTGRGHRDHRDDDGHQHICLVRQRHQSRRTVAGAGARGGASQLLSLDCQPCTDSHRGTGERRGDPGRGVGRADRG